MNHTYNGPVEQRDKEHVYGTYCGRRIPSTCYHIQVGRMSLLLHPPVIGNKPHEYTSRVRENIPGRGLWARRHALQKAYKISFGVNAPCECTDNSSFVNGLKFYMTRMHLMQVNAPGQPGERTLGVNAPHECTHTKSIHNYYKITDLNAPRQVNAPGQAGTNM